MLAAIHGAHDLVLVLLLLLERGVVHTVMDTMLIPYQAVSGVMHTRSHAGGHGVHDFVDNVKLLVGLYDVHTVMDTAPHSFCGKWCQGFVGHPPAAMHGVHDFVHDVQPLWELNDVHTVMGATFVLQKVVSGVLYLRQGCWWGERCRQSWRWAEGGEVP